MLSSGCFHYVPTDLSTAAGGGDIRIHLTRERPDELQELFESPETGSTLGRIVELGGDHLVVRVPLAGPAGVRAPGPAVGRDVRIPLQAVDRVERRELDRLRTAALAVGVIAAAVALLRGMGGEEGGTSQTPPVPPPESALLRPVPP